MTELAAILAARDAERAAGRSGVLATVVGTEGSTYRRPGARMLVGADGARLAGSISGGCLEGDLLSAAGELRAAGGPPTLVHYDSRADADALFGHGTGCQGRVSVLLERLEAGKGSDVLDRLGDNVLRVRRPAVLAHVLGKGPARGQRLLFNGAGEETVATLTDAATVAQVQRAAEAAWSAGRSSWEEVPGAGVVFLEFVAPPPSLTLYGTGPDAAFILRLAKFQGWHVAVGGPRAAGADVALAGADRLVFGSASRLAAELTPEPGGAALVMTHSYLTDLLLLERLVHAPVGYLGILGPRARREKLLSDLAKQGTPLPPADRLERILHAPAGLDLGSDGPEGIALSVVAEIQAVLAQGGCAGHLRERAGPLHAPTVSFASERMRDEG